MKFAFLLARELGMTVGEMLQRMTAEEFELWAEYYHERPFGPDWEDVRSAHMIANLLSPHCKSRLKLKDFLPLRPLSKPMSKELLAQNLRAWSDTYKAANNKAPSAPAEDERLKNLRECQRRAAEQAAKAVTHG